MQKVKTQNCKDKCNKFNAFLKLCNVQQKKNQNLYKKQEVEGC